MLTHYFKRACVSILQGLSLFLLILFLASTLLTNSSLLNRLHDLFASSQRLFLILHLLFYSLLYGLWPKFVFILARSQAVALGNELIKAVVQIRIYLISLFIAMECLTLLR